MATKKIPTNKNSLPQKSLVVVVASPADAVHPKACVQSARPNGRWGFFLVGNLLVRTTIPWQFERKKALVGNFLVGDPQMRARFSAAAC